MKFSTASILLTQLFCLDFARSQKAQAKYVWLNFIGDKKQGCNSWDNGNSMNYTNFIDGYNPKDCYSGNMCIAVKLVFQLINLQFKMLLSSRNGGRWNLIPCQPLEDILTLCVAKTRIK